MTRVVCLCGFESRRSCKSLMQKNNAQVAKLVNAAGSNPVTVRSAGSSPALGTNINSSKNRSVAQSGRAPGLGPGGPRFESLYSDQIPKIASSKMNTE